jgi:hypothetical protein
MLLVGLCVLIHWRRNISINPQGIVLEPAAAVVAVGSLVVGGSVMLWDAITGNGDSGKTPTYNASTAKEEPAAVEPSKLKEGSNGQKLENKLQKSGEDGNLPTPKIPRCRANPFAWQLYKKIFFLYLVKL